MSQIEYFCMFNQLERRVKDPYYCWVKSINRKSINGIPMYTKRVHYGTFQKKCFISYVHIFHVNSLVSIDTFVWTLKTLTGTLLFECHDIEDISDMSSRVLWNFMTPSYKCREHPLMGKYSLVETHMVIQYNTIEEQYVVMVNLSCLSLFLLLSI